MTKKEFLERIKKFRITANLHDYGIFTCIVLPMVIGHKAESPYSKFIKTHLGINIYTCERLNLRELEDESSLRILLTEAFFEECLETKKYKDF